MTFSLRSLLLAFVVIASALGTFGGWGLLVGLGAIGLVAAFHANPRLTFWLVFSGGLLWLLVLCFWPVRSGAREAPRRISCANNLKQIALALHSYHDRYGSFPPAYVIGPDGKRRHSWRVLILPFVEQEALYTLYQFDEPWNGPNNRALAAEIPAVYVCPESAAARTRSGATTYFAVVGVKAAWPGADARRLAEFRDGTINTILVMEAHGPDVSWMEPTDLEFDQIAGRSDSDPEEIIGPIAHPYERDSSQVGSRRVLNVAFADGSVRGLPWGSRSGALALLLTAQCGEDVDLDPPSLPPRRRPFWPRLFSLAVLVLSTLLLWRSTRPAPRGSPGAGQQARQSA